MQKIKKSRVQTFLIREKIEEAETEQKIVG